MKGFLVLAYKNVNDINCFKLENKMKQMQIQFIKNEFVNERGENIISYNYSSETGLSHHNNFYCYGRFMDIDGREKSVDELKEGMMNNEFQGLKGDGIACLIVKNKIIFQNDPDEVRKLFYYNNNNIFCVSNHLPFILSILNEQFVIRKNAVLSMLLNRQVLWPNCFVTGIHVLPPSSIAFYENGICEFTQQSLFRKFPQYNFSFEKFRNELVRTYIESVRQNLNGNAAVALSGGKDSFCLMRLMNGWFADSFTAVSMGYKAEKFRDTNVYNETVFAEKVAKEHGVPFKKFIIDKALFFNEYDSLIPLLDQPGHDPSSNYLFFRLLKRNDFDVVINGLWGDTCFSPRIELIKAMQIFKVFHNTPAYPLVRKFSTRLKYFKALKYFSSNVNSKTPEDFHSLLEGFELTKNPIHQFINKNSTLTLYEERTSRLNYFNDLFQNHTSGFEIMYNYSKFFSPSVYHASIMAERNGLDIIMPFADNKAIAMLSGFNGRQNIHSRNFQLSLFGAEHNSKPVIKKSGFSFPYAEWMPDFAEEVFSYYNDLNYFSDDDFQFDKFQKKYKNDTDFSSKVYPNIVLWKLKLLKDFSEYNGLKF